MHLLKDNQTHLHTDNRLLRQQSPTERIAWLYHHFKPENITLTTSGGATSSIIPHITRLTLESLHIPEPNIIFIDTGYYSSTTIKTINKFESLGYKIKRYYPLLSTQEIEHQYPNWQTTDSPSFSQVKQIIKREPLDRAIKDLHTKVWVSGIMKQETSLRQNLDILEYDKERHIYHFHPILDWDQNQAQEYISANSLPINLHHFDIAKGPNQNLECGIHIKR